MINFNPIDDVAGVVVLYEPTREVLINIQSYIKQVIQLFVVDNSENPDTLIIEKIKKISNAEYIGLNKNIGIAAALNIGAKRAIKGGYKYLLTMDQDSFVTPGLVARMIENCGSIEDVGIISPLHRNKFRTQEMHTSIYEEVLSIKTSGNLLNLKIYQKVGPFKEDYFIDYVDIEYGMRLNLLGFKVLRLNNEILEHSEADLTEKEIMGLRLYPWNHQPFRWYYKVRNLLFLEDEYREHYPDFFWKEKIHYVKQYIKIFLFEKDKFKKVKFAFEGLRAYKNGIAGIRKEK